MVPLQLAAVVLHAVELLHLRDVVLQLHGQRDGHPVTGPRPRTRVQDLDVDRVCKMKHVLLVILKQCG